MLHPTPTPIQIYLQILLNCFLSSKARQLFSKTLSKQDRVTFKSIIYYLFFAVFLFFLNHQLYFYLKPPNLYENLWLARKLNTRELNQWHQQYVKGNTLDSHLQKIIDDSIAILTNTTRRYSYDTFAITQPSHIWAVNSPQFFLQNILHSAAIFILLGLLKMYSKDQKQCKPSFKFQVFALIIIFACEIDLIISTQSMCKHQNSDMLDTFYKAFPVFERRQMLKIMVIPCMSLVEIFVKFYTVSNTQKKLSILSSIAALQQQTNLVQPYISKLKINKHIEDRLCVALEEVKRIHPLQNDLFKLQRELIKNLLYVSRNELFIRVNTERMLRYFILK